MKELRAHKNNLLIEQHLLPTQPHLTTTTMPQPLAIASSYGDLEELYGMTADAFKVR